MLTKGVVYFARFDMTFLAAATRKSGLEVAVSVVLCSKGETRERD